MNKASNQSNKLLRQGWPLILLVVSLWIIVQAYYWSTFIYHDAWKHRFPVTYAVAKGADCLSIPRWLSSVDSGSPLDIYSISGSLLTVYRLPTLLLFSCLKPDVLPAIYWQKMQILLTYLVFCLSSYLLGVILFRHRLSAVFLFTILLFSGLCLEVLHSDQIVSELFYIPWVFICGMLFHRNRENVSGAWYLNGAIFFLLMQTLEHYPHLPVLVAAIGIVLYVSIFCDGTFLKKFIRLLLPRLWPSLILLVLTGIQLWIVQKEIGHYMPSLRSELIVDPKVFGETGFIQPTAFVGSIFSLWFLSGFETFANNMGTWLSIHHLGAPGSKMFIYQFDLVLFFLGILPILCTLVFLLSSIKRKVKIWWVAFTLLVTLVSMQQTHFYQILFHLPFFNIFRGYSLYIVFSVYSTAIMSSYGLDQFLSMSKEKRIKIWKKCFYVFMLLFLSSLAFTLGLLLVNNTSMIPYQSIVSILSKINIRYLLCDIFCIALSLYVFKRAAYSDVPKQNVVGLILIFCICQIIYISGTYKLIGIQITELYSHFNLDKSDLTPVDPMHALRQSSSRKECEVFAQCYLSKQHTVSLHTDQEGTFLRNRNEAVFQKDLPTSIVKALSGISMPSIWFSRRAIPYEERSQLVLDLRKNEENILSHLRNNVYVSSEDFKKLRSIDPRPVSNAEVLSIKEGVDRMQLTYRADNPVFLNAAITYSPSWRAWIDEESTPVFKGNLNGLVIQLPPGSGIIRLQYQSWKGDVFFYSRYIMIIISLLLIVLLTRVVYMGIQKSPKENKHFSEK